MSLPKTISSFRGQYSYMSNFEGGVEVKFQAEKTLDPGEKALILCASAPGRAKKLGRKCSLRFDWEQVKLGIMYDLVLEKFRSNPVFAQKLKATKNAFLVEGNSWHDNYWGDCTCADCSTLRGLNWLGKILMLVRSQISKGKEK